MYKHGTLTGHRMHYREGTKPCEQCQEAKREARRIDRARSNQRKAGIELVHGRQDMPIISYYNLEEDRRWMPKAACSEYPDYCDTPVISQIRICLECPVIQECASYALKYKMTETVWGGHYVIRGNPVKVGG